MEYIGLKKWSLLAASGDDFLYLIEFVKGIYGSKVIDVAMYYLIAHLAKHGVVELEKRELHAAFHARFSQLVGFEVVAVVGFELFEHFVGAAHYRLWHACQLCHMYAETVFAATLHELAHKHHLAVDFLLFIPRLAHKYMNTFTQNEV